MLLFTTDLFSYDKDAKSFVAESSELDLPAEDWNSLRHTPVEVYVELTNPKTNDSRQFKFSHADLNNSPDFPDVEAIGWNYFSKDGLHLLIIND